MAERRTPGAVLTSEIFRQIAGESGAVQNGQLVSTTPEQIADAVMDTVAGTGMDPEMLPMVRSMMLEMIYASVPEKISDGNDDE